ncbi:radical SAM protein [Methanospirillum hungatei]|uniref:radical SAM protein n=1 Tax=Methanospirillum hungatei TaxID=2203 RepID=UPI0026E9F021|nr:radical SAM protein [Methanospirillum hungatei]MCA1917071.1 radical SAM protein [Methanospirillum hungatei]
MTHHIFGPVISRRLGRSLGIDLIPFKTCSYNCVYCECGATTDLTSQRREFFRTDEIIHQVDTILSSSPKLDYITFAGSGEPTLSLSLGPVLTHLKQNYDQYKVAVLTNGSLCTDPDVRRDLLQADLVSPTITTTTQEIFEKIHRPVPGLSVTGIIRGLQSLRNEYTGQIWLEVFLIPGLNTTENELGSLRSAVYHIRPDRIQLNYLDRPGTEAWVSSPDPRHLKRIQEFFAEGGIPVDITGFDEPGAILTQDDSIAQIDETLRRRPCTAEDIAHMTGLQVPDVRKKLALMVQQGIVQAKSGNRGIFYWISSET